MSEIILVELFIAFFLVFVGFAIIDKITPSKSKAYRQSMADMYIVGKIKQIAEKDSININEEFLEFAKVTKNKKIDFEALDLTVERDLQEKISEDKKAAVAPME